MWSTERENIWKFEHDRSLLPRCAMTGLRARNIYISVEHRHDDLVVRSRKSCTLPLRRTIGKYTHITIISFHVVGDVAALTEPWAFVLIGRGMNLRGDNLKITNSFPRQATWPWEANASILAKIRRAISNYIARVYSAPYLSYVSRPIITKLLPVTPKLSRVETDLTYLWGNPMLWISERTLS